MQLNDPEKWAKISLRENPMTTGPEEDNLFEHEDIEDDSTITVNELSSGISEQHQMNTEVVMVPDGHMELSLDQNPEPRDVMKMSIAEIIAEVESSGRGRRRRTKSRRYDDDNYEAH